MALELHPKRSKWWYARVVVDGRKLNKNLGVEWRGVPPLSLRGRGDEAFELSRAKAQAALERLQLDLKKRSTAEELVQTLHELRTGARIASIPLSDVDARWLALPRRRPLAEKYVTQAKSYLKRFVSFVNATAPRVRNMDQVQGVVARAFFKQEEDRGVSPKTYNNELIHLRSVFEALKRDAGLAENPFAGIPTRDGETFFRRPFSAEELGLIVQAAKRDPFIYPLIVTGMCTAMRRGDCCTLLRESVDLEGGFVTVKTSKTGETVLIPIFPLFRDVLAQALAKPSPRPPHYVFPELEAHYQINPDHLTDRVRRVMKAAGFFDVDEDATEDERQKCRGAVQAERKDGLRKASLRDFHSFRVTWVTLALTAGVPMEIVRKVTGHRTAEIVMKHYFQPGREEFRRTLAGKLPAVIGGPAEAKQPTLLEVIERIRAMRANNWKRIRAELLEAFSEKRATAVEVVVEALSNGAVAKRSRRSRPNRPRIAPPTLDNAP